MPRARRRRSSFRAVPPSKMAAVKSLEDMLSSEVDEPAVNALVASLESQLASTNAQHPNQDVGSIASVNHVNSTTVDGPSVRLLDGPKPAVGAATQAVTTSSVAKTVVSSISQFPDDLQSATSTASSVMVTLPGALPASGYITQVTGTPQPSFFNPAGGAIRPLTTSSQDIKIVYTTQSVVSPAINNTLRSNLKSSTIANGNPTPVSITIRSGQPLVTASALNPVSALSGSTTSMSAIHDLANIASQQRPIIIPSTCGSVPTIPIVTTSTLQASQRKPASRPTTRMQLRDRGGKSTTTDVNSKAALPSRSQEPSLANTATTQSVSAPIATKSQPVTSHVNVVSQVVTNQGLPPGVQIINVNPRLGPPGLGAKTLAPRVLVTNPVRIAAAPQIMTTRPGVAGQRSMTPNAQIKVERPFRQVHVARSCLSPKFLPVQGNKNTITLQPGMVRSAIIVKTENGPLQVVNIAGASGGALPAGTTYRLQSLPPGVQGVRTLSPQQMTVTVPVSGTNIKGNQASVSGAQTIVGTLVHQGTPLSAVGSRLQGPNITSQTHQTVAVKVGVNGSLSTPLTVQTTTANNQAPGTPSQQMSPNTAKKKCKNFLSTLIRLADEQPPSVAKSVRNLIQGIIDGTIQAEEFTAKLQKELNSAPQPYLVPFLKKNLPFLRHSLITKELTIEGVRPPPPGALSLPHPSQMGNIHLQASQKRPTTHLGTPVRLVTTSSQLIHTNQNLTQRFVSPRAPTALIGSTKSLLVSQMNKASLGGSVAASSPATVSALQAKSTLARTLPLLGTKDKGKSTFSALRDDDDINDVAAMGGVNLMEESQKILASNSELVGTQIRSCKDESFLLTGSLFRKIHLNATKLGLEEVAPEVPALVAHAAQEMLKTLIEKLAIIAEHRVDNPKNDCRYEVMQDVKGQIKFIEELDKLEHQRHEKQEWEILLRAAKSRSKLEDPEQLKLKQKAKEMQRAELEKMRQQEANTTALMAIGPRKKMKMDSSVAGSSQAGTSGLATPNNTYQKALPRPRMKRVNLRDLLFLLEQERETVRTPLLYKAYLK